MDQRLNSMSRELVHPADRETEGISVHLPGFNYRVQFTGHLSITGLNPTHEANQSSALDMTRFQLKQNTHGTKGEENQQAFVYSTSLSLHRQIHTLAVRILHTDMNVMAILGSR